MPLSVSGGGVGGGGVGGVGGQLQQSSVRGRLQLIWHMCRTHLAHMLQLIWHSRIPRLHGARSTLIHLLLSDQGSTGARCHLLTTLALARPRSTRNVEDVARLVVAGADVNAVVRNGARNGATPPHVAAQGVCVWGGDAEVVARRGAAGANVNPAVRIGGTPLLRPAFRAARISSVRFVGRRLVFFQCA